MGSIASYQEGYADGFEDGKEMSKKYIIEMLYTFIREQKDKNTDTLYVRGYDLALCDLKEYIEDAIIEV